jgi:hypothetical protein
MPNYKSMMDLPYLGAYSLEGVKNNEMALTIKTVKAEKITGEGGLQNKKPVIYFEEPNVKPMVLNSTNAKTITLLAGSPITEKWAGLRIIVYATKTRFGKEMVDCLRIRPFLAEEPSQAAPTHCADCGNEIKPHTLPSGKIFTAAQIAENGVKKFGRTLCMDCVPKANQPEANKEDTGNGDEAG